MPSADTPRGSENTTVPTPGTFGERISGLKRSKPEPGLHIVATPIGNLGDITVRALDTLAAADAVACEDTRKTGRLLQVYGLKRPLVRYDDHAGDRALPGLMERLERGEIVALVTDAGTPLISDPGYRLVAAAREAGHPVTTAPGASSVMAALSIAGLPTDRFLFAGFLPPRSAARRKVAAALPTDTTLVLFESARRLAAALADLADVLGPRDAAICRELTKLHEEAVSGSLADLAKRYAASDAPKGEIVIVVAPAAEGSSEDRAGAVDAALQEALETMGVRDAAATVAAATGASKRAVYARALELSAERRDRDA